MLQVRNVGAGSLRAWFKRRRHVVRMSERSSAAWTSTLVSNTSNYSSSITRYSSSRSAISTRCPPLFHDGNGGRASACSPIVAGSASMRRSPASTKADIVVPRRGASSRRRCITESSMLRVVFIWITVSRGQSGTNGRGGRSCEPSPRGLGCGDAWSGRVFGTPERARRTVVPHPRGPGTRRPQAMSEHAYVEAYPRVLGTRP